MDSYRISDAARETGFTASALRFYEREGIVVPERSSNGYRRYDERSLARLGFIARAKRLGLSLEDTADMLTLLEDEECAPVQARLRALVETRIGEAQGQVADLVVFIAELQRVARRLSEHTTDGPCDEHCGCKTDGPHSGRQLPVVEPMLLAGRGAASIACSLEPDGVDGRIKAWRQVVGQALEREPLTAGVRLRFARGVDVGAISELAAAEQECCAFFGFTISIGSDAITLDVTGPPEAQHLIASFAGA